MILKCMLNAKKYLYKEIYHILLFDQIISDNRSESCVKSQSFPIDSIDLI